MRNYAPVIVGAAAMAYLMALGLLMATSEAQSVTPSKVTEDNGKTYEWHNVNSPFEGYVCKTHRTSVFDRGYESTVCIKKE